MVESLSLRLRVWRVRWQRLSGTLTVYHACGRCAQGNILCLVHVAALHICSLATHPFVCVYGFSICRYSSCLLVPWTLGFIVLLLPHCVSFLSSHRLPCLILLGNSHSRISQIGWLSFGRRVASILDSIISSIFLADQITFCTCFR